MQIAETEQELSRLRGALSQVLEEHASLTSSISSSKSTLAAAEQQLQQVQQELTDKKDELACLQLQLDVKLQEQQQEQQKQVAPGVGVTLSGALSHGMKLGASAAGDIQARPAAGLAAAAAAVLGAGVSPVEAQLLAVEAAALAADAENLWVDVQQLAAMNADIRAAAAGLCRHFRTAGRTVRVRALALRHAILKASAPTASMQLGDDPLQQKSVAAGVGVGASAAAMCLLAEGAAAGCSGSSGRCVPNERSLLIRGAPAAGGNAGLSQGALGVQQQQLQDQQQQQLLPVEVGAAVVEHWNQVEQLLGELHGRCEALLHKPAAVATAAATTAVRSTLGQQQQLQLLGAGGPPGRSVLSTPEAGEKQLVEGTGHGSGGQDSNSSGGCLTTDSANSAGQLADGSSPESIVNAAAAGSGGQGDMDASGRFAGALDGRAHCKRIEKRCKKLCTSLKQLQQKLQALPESEAREQRKVGQEQHDGSKAVLFASAAGADVEGVNAGDCRDPGIRNENAGALSMATCRSGGKVQVSRAPGSEAPKQQQQQLHKKATIEVGRGTAAERVAHLQQRQHQQNAAGGEAGAAGAGGVGRGRIKGRRLSPGAISSDCFSDDSDARVLEQALQACNKALQGSRGKGHVAPGESSRHLPSSSRQCRSPRSYGRGKDPVPGVDEAAPVGGGVGNGRKEVGYGRVVDSSSRQQHGNAADVGHGGRGRQAVGAGELVGSTKQRSSSNSSMQLDQQARDERQRSGVPYAAAAPALGLGVNRSLGGNAVNANGGGGGQSQVGGTGREDATRRMERAALMLRLQQYLGGQPKG